mgnify:CR=1 FL=1
MTRSETFNFSAGPSVLPEEVLRQAQAELLNYHGTGMSVMEMSHRSQAFSDIFQDVKARFRAALSVPDTHEILFLQGGGTAQFSMIPLNLMGEQGTADYAVTGHFSGNAAKEAEKYGAVHIAADTSTCGHTRIPQQSELRLDARASYFYYCANNTIYGTEYHEDLVSPVPLIADMSSDILSRPVDVTKYAMIYGGAQKNLAPAGVAFAIIREDMLDKIVRDLPTMVSFRTHVENGSMFNTPPVFPIYVLKETLKWLKSIGGIPEIYRRNQAKAALLYDEIDRNPLFRGTVDKEDRSLMNICFVMADGYEELAPEFMEAAKSRGIVGIKGHRLVGGFRASCYNALPVESVRVLVECMQEFAAKHAK